MAYFQVRTVSFGEGTFLNSYLRLVDENFPKVTSQGSLSVMKPTQPKHTMSTLHKIIHTFAASLILHPPKKNSSHFSLNFCQEKYILEHQEVKPGLI